MTDMEKEETKIQLVQEKERSEEDILARSQKKERRIVAAILILLTVAAFVYSFWNRKFQTYEELTSTPNSDANATRIASYQDGYMKYSQDGISYLNSKEKIQWTEAYSMTNPSLSVKGEYAVIADIDGNEVQLYDKNGKIGDYSMPYLLKSVQVASQGVFCVVLEGNDANYIRLYDQEGNILADIKTQIENNGYPLAVAISSDGTKLAASFCCIDGINSKNVLSFYNFGEGGKGQSGNLVGTYQFDDTLIPKLEFMDDETVCAIGDNQTILYRMKEKPKKIKQINFEQEIKSVFSSDKYIGYLCENDEEKVEQGKAEPYQLLIYNKNGRLKKSYGWDTLYENMIFQDDVLYCYTGSVCSVMRLNGTEFFHQDMGQNIVNILPTNNRRELFFVYNSRSSRVRLKNSLKLKFTKEAEETETTEE
jgi:hypothetical protein